MCVNVEMNPQNMCVDVEMNPQHILRIVCWVIEAHSPNNSCIVCVDVEMSPQYIYVVTGVHPPNTSSVYIHRYCVCGCRDEPQYILFGYRSSPSKHLSLIHI